MNREGLQISDEELKSIQRVQMELIAEVDRICKKNRIHYNMVGGTMLGAIRHQGHIPWDDDADIGFLRSQYERFREACKTDLNTEKYYFQDFRDTPGYRRGYGKLRMRNTAFVRLGQESEPFEQGIFIDLMPFDNVPNGTVRRKNHFLRCFLFRKMLWSEMGKINEKNIAIRCIYRLMSIVPENIIKKQFQSFINRNNKRRTELVRILTFPTPKECFGYRREWYTDLRLYRFGDMMLPGAKDYDGYLKVKYGDYMSLPPEEKRKVHPISKLVLPEGESNG